MKREHEQVDADAGAADEGEADGPPGHHSQQQGVKNRDAEIPDHRQVELGFPRAAGLKTQRHLGDSQVAMAEGQQFIEKLEPVDIHLTDKGETALRPEREEPTHVIAQMAVARQAETGHRIRPGGVSLTPLTQAHDRGLRVEATADHKIGPSLQQGGNDPRNGEGLVLAVAVHDHHHIAGGIEDPFLDCTGETEPAHPPDQPDTVMIMGQLTDFLGRAVAGIIIDEQQLKIEAPTQRQQFSDNRLYVVTLIEGGEDHRKTQTLILSSHRDNNSKG